MEVEQFEVYEFLRRFAPFNSLPEPVLKEVAAAAEVGYFRGGTQIVQFGQPLDALHVIRSGTVEVYRRSGELYNRLDEGDIFGQLGLLMSRRVRFPARAVTDTLLYFIPAAVFDDLFENHESFADYVEIEDRTRLRQAVTQARGANDSMTSKVMPLVTRTPVTLEEGATVRQAAARMTEEGVSSLIITADKSREGGSGAAGHGMAGIVTDRDLRTRVLAAGLSLDTPVADVMSRELVTIESGQRVFEALLSMLRHNLHHLPVLRRGKPVGMIAISDIVRYESQNSLFVVGRILRQNTVDDLASLAPEVRSSFVRLVNEDANSHMVGSAMAVIGRSFKQRLLELAEEALGPPPVPYCYLALGSMARDEQGIVTDQDNALIIDDRFDKSRHDDYFLKLARFVSDGLARCGYVYCSGGVMATNEKWRQPLHVWRKYFADWIDRPSPEALLNSSIFFDLDGVFGRTEWVEQLRSEIAARAKGNHYFLACMARNALNRTPPLGFFKSFVLEKDGKQRDTINLKRRGTAPLTDLVRVHALAVGSKSQNTFDRLEDVVEAKALSAAIGSELRDALEFIALVRIRHQALELEAGQEADNSVEPERLSHFERRSLKDAFQVLSNAQKFLKFHYQPNRSA